MTSIELHELWKEDADALRTISHYKRFQKHQEVFHHVDTKEKIENLTMRNAEQRIIAYMQSIGADKAAVPLEIPKTQLAALLDLTPESVSRVFTHLADKQILAQEGKNYRLLINP